MKILLTLLLLIPLPFYAQTVDRPYIISGFDDVLRQSENTGLIQATLGIFKEDKTFTGMSELYQIVSSHEENPKFVVVSAIPDWFQSKIEDFLTKNHYPTHLSFLRSWPFEWSIDDFKIRHIQNIIRVRPSRHFIVIFDNSEASIQLSEKLPGLFPEIVAVYLRQVSTSKIPVRVRRFFTAFDIAYQEFLSGRMSTEDLEKIGSLIVKETRRENIIPSYAVCPDDYEICKEKTICSEVAAHIRKLCRY